MFGINLLEGKDGVVRAHECGVDDIKGDVRLQAFLELSAAAAAAVVGQNEETMEVDDTLNFLLGKWTVERSIADHRSGARVHFNGIATLVEAGPTRGSRLGRRAFYDEAGELHVGTHTGPASRSLECVRLADTTVMLHFTGGRPFVDLDLRTGFWQSIHHCGEDRYEITTDVRSQTELQEHWRVWGPAKDYVAVTTLRRVDASGAPGDDPPSQQ